MGKETPLVTHAEAERVRKNIAKIGEQALANLAAELPLYGRKKVDGQWCTVPLPEGWARNYKTVADQLRRDYRLDASEEEEDESPAAAPADPLAGLRIVGGKEAG
jgi:hypothetical protein